MEVKAEVTGSFGDKAVPYESVVVRAVKAREEA